MKRLFSILFSLGLCVVLLGSLVPAAQAESAASRVDIQVSVNNDGDATVNMGINLRMEEPRSTLYFPLPLGAKNVSLNNFNASVTRNGNVLDVDLSRITRDYVGEAPIQISYTLPEVVKVAPKTDEKTNETTKEETGKKTPDLLLTLPLLNGFELPIENFSFTITLPQGNLTSDPEFYSTYRQGSLASDLNAKVSGSQIIATSTKTLHDHDGVVVTMIVPKDMFKSVSTYIREGNPELIPMLICFGVALVYWLIFLASLPVKGVRSVTPPEGITAGEMGCRLTTAGGDLTAMVFSWAQLGYILIEMQGSRVLLRRRMDMGNERSQFENKVFSLLFGEKTLVDATGNAYAKLCRKVSNMHPNERILYKGSVGAIKIFRCMACISQVFCAICVAMNMTEIFALQIILSILLSIIALPTAWLMQGGAYRIFLRGKLPLYYALASFLLWVILGFSCKQVFIPLGCSLGQIFIGYLAAYGGRRSKLGRHEAEMVLGFRKYAKRMPRYDISRLLENDPDYFFNYAPYALALGVMKPFAFAFGRRKMDPCPYLVSTATGKRTAEEWGQILTIVANRMDEKYRMMAFERLMSIQIHIDIGRKPR